MVTTLILITLFTHIILPLIFILWIAFSKGKCQIYQISIALFGGSWIVFISIAGAGWSWLSLKWPWVFACLLIPALWKMYQRLPTLPLWPEKKIFPILGTLSVMGCAFLFTLSLPELVSLRQYEGQALSLTFPLQKGTYQVVQGGYSETINHHFKIPAQKYALDLVKQNAWGIRAKGLLPEDLEKYEIFSDPLVAPCDGEVLLAQGSYPDLTPPKKDRDHIIGNHLVLFCQQHSILLAHLKHNSLLVKVGEQVKKGDMIAQIGNTGNTSEPHLHIHAVQGRFSKIGDLVFKQKGVAMLFNDQFLIRNDVITATHLISKSPPHSK